MLVRDYTAEDEAEVRKIHEEMAQGYDFPALDDPLFIVRKVVTDETGKILGLSACRIEAETYLILTPNAHPKVKMEAISSLAPALEKSAWQLGISNLVAWIPEFMEKKFSKRLHQLGWTRDKAGWHSWQKQLAEAIGELRYDEPKF